MPLEFVPPRGLREESRQREWPCDRWIYAYVPPEGKEGVYRPVWRTVIVDQYGSGWLALVDAETAQVLQVQPTAQAG